MKSIIKHNLKRKPRERLYNIWLHMKDRCYNKNFYQFHNYGARGIKVCEEWKIIIVISKNGQFQMDIMRL